MEKYKGTSSYDRFKKLKEECELLAKEVELYLANEELLNSIIKAKSEMGEEQLNSFVFYDIHLDCYSKNDLGNEVLGRFVFPFTKDGVYVDDNTTLQMVEKLN